MVKGILTYFPGVSNWSTKRRTSAAASATFCYEVWLKHITMLWESGMRVIPNTLAELGPGSPLGIGRCFTIGSQEMLCARCGRVCQR